MLQTAMPGGGGVEERLVVRTTDKHPRAGEGAGSSQKQHVLEDGDVASEQQEHLAARPSSTHHSLSQRHTLILVRSVFALDIKSRRIFLSFLSPKVSHPLLTELPGGLDIDVVVAAANADDDAQSLELLQVLPGQRDGVVHHGAHRLVQHLPEKQRRQERTNSYTVTATLDFLQPVFSFYMLLNYYFTK